MEDTNVHATTSSSEEIETGYGEEGRHEESELQYDQERDITFRVSRNEESSRDENDTYSDDTDGDEHGKGNSRPLSPSSNEESVTGSNEDIENQSGHHPSPSESDTDSHSECSARDIDVEQEQKDNSSGDPSMDAHDLQTSTEGKDDSETDGGTNIQQSQKTRPLGVEEDEDERVGDVDMLKTHSPETENMQETHSPDTENMQETQNGAGVVTVDHHEAPLPVDDVDEGSMETHSFESESTQETQGNTGAVADDHHEAPLPLDEVAEGSMEITPETDDDSNTQVSADMSDAPVSTPEERNKEDQSTTLHEENKPSSSEGNVTREIEPALMELGDQNSLDSSKAAEEHVHEGSTCDGCTEEEDDEQLREYWTRALQTSTSTGEVVEEIVKVLKHRQKTHDLLCPVCGSCVTRRVILRKRKRSSSMSVERWFPEPVDEGEATEPVEEQEAREEYQDTEAFGCLACFSLFFEKGRQFLNQLQADMTPESFNCLPFFFPPYPWGMTEMKSRSPDGLSSQEVEEEAALDVREPAPTSPQSDYTCGIGSTILPDYPWGTMPHLSQGEAIQPPTMTDTVVVDEERGVSETVDIEETSDRTRTCGLGPAMLPDYPWGHCTKAESSGQQIQVPEPVGAAEERTCTCGLVPALFPDYAWGHLSRVEAGPKDSSSEDTAAPQGEISEEVPQLHRESRTCTCGLLPALLPDYPWGFCTKDEGAYTEPTPIVPQAQPEEEIKGKEAEDKGPSCLSAVLPDYSWGMTTETQVLEEGPSGGEDMQHSAHVDCSSAILPSYPWGVCSAEESVLEQKSSAQNLQGAAARDCTCGLGAAMLPLFPWGQTLSAVVHSDDKKEEIVAQEVQSYITQNTKIEARITSETDVFTVTTSKTTYPGEKPPPSIKNMIPQETSQTVQHVRLDQTVTIIDASIQVEGVPPPSKVPPLVSLPSTGFALLDMAEEEKGRLESKPSTGYAQLQEIEEDEADSEIQEDPMSIKYPQPKPKDNEQPTPEELYHKPGKTRPEPQSIGTPFPSFQWSVGKLDAGDVTTPLLQASAEAEGDTFVSVLKPTPGVKESKSENWLSIFQLSKPPEKEGITSPLLPAKVHGYVEEIEEVKLPDVRPPAATEAVVDIPPADLGGPSVGTLPTTDTTLPAIKKKDPDGWDILKSIVYGGLDISVASLGVTSSAAGGNAITRTVVYMGLATLLSGLIGFYHNVLNLYHYHRDHYTDMVGVSLMLHGTVAIISYIVFGLLSPLVYLFSYRKTDDRDDKFILCCVVSIVAVTALALGKAKVSNKRYLRTVSAYLLGGVLAAIVGYLTGEHVAELLEEWGI